MRQETQSAELHPDLSIRILLAVLEEQRLDPRPALRAAGVDSNSSEDLPAFVSGERELAVQRAFTQSTGYRPDLWLMAGLRYHFAAFGSLGLYLMTSRDLLQIAETRLRVYFSYTASYTHPIYDDGELVGQVLDLTEVADDMAAFSACHAFGTVCALYSDILGQPFPFTRIDFALPDPGPRFRALLPMPATFDAENTAWYWQGATARLRLPFHDQTLNRILADELQRELDRKHDRSDIFLTKVRQSIKQGQRGQLASVGEVAESLNLTPRTLQRRLAMHGIGFRELVESIRREAAIGMLLSTEMQVAEIAFHIGYADPAAFEHAFRRWTGGSPRQFRAKSMPTTCDTSCSASNVTYS